MRARASLSLAPPAPTTHRAHHRGRGVDVDAKTEKESAPLLLAAQNGHEAVVRQLLGAKASVDHANKDGITPLYSAARVGMRTHVDRLVQCVCVC